MAVEIARKITYFNGPYSSQPRSIARGNIEMSHIVIATILLKKTWGVPTFRGLTFVLDGNNVGSMLNIEHEI